MAKKVSQNGNSVSLRLRKFAAYNKGLLVFAVLFGALGAYLTFSTMAAPRRTASATLSLTPSSQRVSMSETLTIAVWEDSLTTSVNAVQADLVYPADKFEFVGIDAAGSAFDIGAHTSGGNGSISVVRGHTSSLTGRQFVANVMLKSKVSSGKAGVTFASTSSLLGTADNSNVLQQTVGGRYTLAP